MMIKSVLFCLKKLTCKLFKQGDPPPRKAIYNPHKIPSQAYFIKLLIQSCGYKSYLEMGVYHGTTFKYVKDSCELAHAVDIEYKNFIDKNSFFHMSTDAFFSQAENTYDLIFIDACHKFEQVKKDFDNALRILNKNGTILLHDTDPYSKEYLNENRCFDCYKMNEYLATNSGIQFITLPMDETGLTLIKNKTDMRHLIFL